MTDSRVRSYESLSGILEGKNVRTVVIYLAGGKERALQAKVGTRFQF
jgi:hypothetical protein